MHTYKILGLLLSYPRENWVNELDEIKTVLEAEDALPAKTQKKVMAFIQKLSTRNLMKSQEDYVALFDRGRAHCLHLFEHVHGESRDRGQAMVDLSDLYKEKGLEINAAELPDYLPMFLEFLSVCSFEEAQEYLGDIIHIVAAIGAKLERRKSDYSVVFKAIEQMTNLKADKAFVDQALKEDAETDDSLEALDKEWEDSPAFDGAGDADCGTCSVATNQMGAAQSGAMPHLNS